MITYLKDVTTIAIDEAACIGCASCVEVCPRGVLAMSGRTAAVVDRDACIECGACAMNCPVGAATVEPGVGCASAILLGMIRGTAPQCGCDEGTTCCSS
jgi:NAD-dependent dihydropyrimidine dehydrogenase PreA subunit